MKFISSKKNVEYGYKFNKPVVVKGDDNKVYIGQVLLLKDDMAKVGINLEKGLMLVEWIKF